MTVKDRIIIALDYSKAEEALACANKLQGTASYVKVGMQLYYGAGPTVVGRLKDMGFKVFVDLKVHDIPNTAKGAMKSLAALGVDMVNVHAAGGKEMMMAAREGLEQGAGKGRQPLLIGVTQLTSTTQETMNQQIGITGSIADCVKHYAILAKEAGLDGVVASPLEVPLVKESCGDSFITVTPGIRPAGADVGDQKRITTPEMAFELGSDYIVIGRPVTQAADPAAAMSQIIENSEG
ncbi:orotidine-5'-phosphate decarboxylase [Ammoniphilus sp. CFH 90114]|uniref:orotidine-5'-phosphate decarboxylase n=1 Tax=Ammoniphilus sp. CFH 90114 TaxID=2493665 RepID=UPI00100E21A6|nr:orotidine-5'-phosphate decarboxylase [Ammoniphilus sp. CFH 90114]RXT15511.1 orotidine-5'-phosphate decarboxylase [Ammoniphilus sp. CFH 90114]